MLEADRKYAYQALQEHNLSQGAATLLHHSLSSNCFAEDTRKVIHSLKAYYGMRPNPNRRCGQTEPMTGPQAPSLTSGTAQCRQNVVHARKRQKGQWNPS